MKKKEKLLLDMDGCLVALHMNWQNRLRELYPRVNIDFSQIKQSITDECYNLWGITEQECIRPFYEQGFWLNLPPQDDCLEYIPKIDKIFDIIIVTKSHLDSPYCSYEKYKWIMKYFGKEFKFVQTKYKSLVRGRWIVDDMVDNIEKCLDRGKTVFIYDQPWNRFFNKGGIRVKSWKAIYDYLNDYVEIKNH